jgi:hypothetical protein
LIFDSGIVPTVWYEYGLIFDSGIVPTVWYLILELFRQCGMIMFFILYIGFSCICNNVSDFNDRNPWKQENFYNKITVFMFS